MNILQSLVEQILEVSLAMSLVIAILLLLRPILGKRYRSNMFYWIWFLAALRLAVPLNFSIFPEPVNFNVPDTVLVHSDVPEVDKTAPSVMEPTLSPDMTNDSHSEQAEAVPTTDNVITIGQIVSIIWALGTGIFFAGSLIAYARFRRKIHRWSQTYADSEGLALFDELKRETGVKHISAMLCYAVPSPLVVGFIRPTLLLPKDNYTHEELEAIFCHELIHVRRCDLWYKLLLLIARSFHWFNPIVHLMARRGEEDLEISCDEEVVKGKPASFQSRYGHAVLSVAENDLNFFVSLTTHFKGKNTMKERLSTISGKTGQHKGTLIVLLVALTVTLVAAGCSLNSTTGNMSSEKEKQTLKNNLDRHESSMQDFPSGDVNTVEMPEGSSSAENDGQPYGQPKDFDANGLPAAFAAAIKNYCYDGTLPDGRGGDGIPTSISYAVYDIDGDGRDELFLQNSDTIMAGMTEKIYDWEDGVFHEKYSEFPDLTYYDNGVILAGWSHNQGPGGDKIWPYYLYQYRSETDSYEVLGSVDSWNREDAEFIYELGAFPDETDADRDGCVYFLLPPDWEGDYSRARIVDGPEYETWRDQYLHGADTLEIPYRKVEVETIFPNAQN